MKMSEGESKRLPEINSGPVEMQVSLSYGDLKVEFKGPPESVLHSLNAFVAKHLPAFDLAKKLSLNYNAKDMIEKFQNYVRITPEGPRVIFGETKLSDKELVALQLVAQRIAFDTGTSENAIVSLVELQEITGLNAKTLSSRLSELSKAGRVARESTEEGTKFRITTQGISWLLDTLNKKGSSNS